MSSIIGKSVCFAVLVGVVLCSARLNNTSFSSSEDVINSSPLFDFGTDNPYRAFNQWVNRFFFSDNLIHWIQKTIGNEEISYYLTCYFRDWVAGTAVYWGFGSIWHFFIYSFYGTEIFTEKGRPFPSWDTLKDQMITAQWAIFVYASLPVISEYFIESGYTKTYFYISEIGGWKNYFLGLFAYVCCFEMGIYWAHRKLHTVKFLYKHLHSTHHKYNKAETMTPWASIAFNPFDGMLQAASYLLFLPIVPVHYFTHVFLLFFSGVWATNIHDSVPMDSEPLMGAAYHTIHHTHYHYNFGQWFIFCDWMFGTLRSRKDIEAMKENKKVE